LQYTGGTTGVAKGAMLTHGNIVANMLQAKSMINQVDDNGNPLYTQGSEIIVAPLPLYHIYSFTIHLMCLFSAGEHSIFIADPRNTKMFIRMIRPFKFTGFVGLNTLFVSLMEHPDFKKCDFSEFKLTLSGGTALTSDTVYRWREATGCDIAEGYGLTECSPIACGNPSGGLARIGTVGVPAPNTAVKVIGEDGNELPFGERGELCIRGPQVMKGYWQRPDETAKTFTNDGWLKTGDIATIEEDGYVKIVDRLKDLIIVSGFNVYPNEIEDVLAKLNGVLESAAIGVPDDKSGEAVKVVIVKKDPSLTSEQVITHCRQNLTNYKVPRYVEFRHELPKTNVGKILRRALREPQKNS
jgi:long-chain acyl-CoA synthetase